MRVEKAHETTDITAFSNPLTPKNDEPLISPHNITPESHKCHENKGNDHQLKKLPIDEQILISTTSENMKRKVWRKWLLILGC